ncbi:MAG: hypothetical protein JWL70_2239 [Acidimicrobiia bacterium]|nr:hypothetical protein [Acidimicrobiia bacterium]
MPFLHDAVARQEPTLVALTADKNEALRQQIRAVPGASDMVMFADMTELGLNPARIIPAWHDFLAHHGSPARRLRGIGESIWAGRTDAEIAECHRHEALLNVAFDDPPLWLLCPYDLTALSESVITEARHTHPYLWNSDHSMPSDHYRGPEAMVGPFADPLPEPPPTAALLNFRSQQLREVRRFLAAHCAQAGLSAQRSQELILAVNELATNGLLYGGGEPTLAVWQEPSALICEMRDQGHVTDPLVGRQRPAVESPSGRGMWIVNQLCDLVQLRQFPAGTTVRVHVRLAQ